MKKAANIYYSPPFYFFEIQEVTYPLFLRR
jgi:hypothetical protein